ncbi:MAG: arginase [Litorivivens sp.]|jgi:arginase
MAKDLLLLYKIVGQLITIIEVNSELGAGTRGASLGSRSLQTASLSSEKSIFSDKKRVKVETENDLLLDSTTTISAKYIDGISRMFDRICDQVSKTLSAKEFPFVLAGDHSSAGATIAGIKAANPNKRLGIIWIDAHADLHSPYTSPSGNVHGMPLATAIAYDNMEMASKEPSIEAIEAWESLKNTGGSSPKVLPEDIVFIGVRDTEKPEDRVCEKFNIKNFSVEEVRAQSVKTTAQDALIRLKECDIVYVSFDVDSLDPSISLGTGTPVPNGFEVKEVSDMLDVLLIDPKVCCFEVVEINPLLDTTNKMAKAVYPIIERAYYSIAAR